MSSFFLDIYIFYTTLFCVKLKPCCKCFSHSGISSFTALLKKKGVKASGILLGLLMKASLKNKKGGIPVIFFLSAIKKRIWIWNMVIQVHLLLIVPVICQCAFLKAFVVSAKREGYHKNNQNVTTHAINSKTKSNKKHYSFKSIQSNINQIQRRK